MLRVAHTTASAQEQEWPEEVPRWWVQYEGCCAQTLFRLPSALHPRRHSSRQHQRGERLARGARDVAFPSQVLVSPTYEVATSVLEGLRLVPAKADGGQPPKGGSHH